MSTTTEQLVNDLDIVAMVVEDTNKFKVKLGIGEDAYATLKLTSTLKGLWGVKGAMGAGAAAAASPVVATTLFGSSAGILSSVGLGAVAATPVGWIIGAAVVSGGAYYGVMRTFSKYEDSRVEKIPKFINTPLDLLGSTLFDMMAGMALKIADFSGGIEDCERDVIKSYFQEEWGLAEAYVSKALPIIESNIKTLRLKEMARSLAEFQLDNPDCNPAAMGRDFKQFLEEVVYADGELSEREEIAIDVVEREISTVISSTNQIARNTSKYAKVAGSYAQDGALAAGKVARHTSKGVSKLLGKVFK